MDTLRSTEIDYFKRLTPAERLGQALSLMEDGFSMQRASLRRRNPTVNDQQLEALFQSWLLATGS